MFVLNYTAKLLAFVEFHKKALVGEIVTKK